VLEQIVLVYRTLSECQVAACSTGSARTQKNRADRICQCLVGARHDQVAVVSIQSEVAVDALPFPTALALPFHAASHFFRCH